MASDSGERTEAPTPKKLAESRKEGQVARTPDLGAWLGILAATLIVPGLLGALMDRSISLLHRAIKLVAEPDTALAMTLLRDAALDGALVLAPLVITLPVIALFAGVVQGGLHIATKNLKLQPKRSTPPRASSGRSGRRAHGRGSRR